MNNILLEILEKKREDLKSVILREEGRRVEALLRGSSRSHTTNQHGLRRFFDSLSVAQNDINIIAEIKFASPTNPHLGSREELLERAKKYETAGADAISIITEKHFFKGDITFVSQVKSEVSIPVLQKDFVIDERQIYQAKAIGSDALLLIARLVDEKTLKHFVDLCFDLGIESVVEINNDEDLEKAIATDTKIIAVNARDLETFQVDISSACRLMKKIPDGFIRLGFSGIKSSDEVQQYKKAGANGILVGTALMNARDIKGFISLLRAERSNLNTQKEIATSSFDNLRTPRNDSVVKIKICGIRTLGSAEAAVAAGADFLGFNFVPTSKRKVSVDIAKKIISLLRTKKYEPRTKFVGIFQNQSVDEVNKIAKLLDLDFVQLHGEEDEDYMKKIKTKIIKKYNLHSFTNLNEYSEYVLLDREVQGKGEMVDLEKAAGFSKNLKTFFSGGLTPENVADVVKKVQPFAVDVAGGIETDGEIDNDKMKRFIKNVKEVVV